VTFGWRADFTGTGAWADVAPLTAPPGETMEHALPDAFGAYWLGWSPTGHHRSRLR